MVQICPECKKTIPEDILNCPHCDKRAVLFPLGITMMIILLGYNVLIWRGMIPQNSIVNPIIIAAILIGMVFYGAYIGKGDKDFWFGK